MNHTKHSRRKVFAGALGVLGAAASVQVFRAQARAHGLETQTRVGMAFQTPFALTVAGDDRKVLSAVLDESIAAIRDVENASSVYRPDSDLSRLNRDGRIVRPHRHLVAMVAYALRLAAETDGAFDPTVQPLWDVWASHHARGERPSDATLRQTLRRVDWRGVTLSPENIAFDRPGMAMTLNSINQGYAADVVMECLVAHGVAHAFVDTGEFGARGHHPEGRAWRLGVASSRAPEMLAFTLDPFRRFAATSGDYETYFSPDFRDHHIFDPKTGRSRADWSSITVEAPSGLIADGLSTALFTLDREECRQLLARHRDCAARFLDKRGGEVQVAAANA